MNVEKCIQVALVWTDILLVTTGYILTRTAALAACCGGIIIIVRRICRGSQRRNKSAQGGAGVRFSDPKGRREG